MTGRNQRRVVGTVLLVLAGLGAPAGAARGASVASGSTSVEPTATPPSEGTEPVGRLMFSRFDEATHTFISTHVANADGSDETEIVLPGPEGGGRWSRAGTEIALMTVLPDERIGTAVIAPDGTLLRVLEPPDDSLNLVCVVWSPDDSRLACEGWDETDPSRNGIYDVRSSDGGDVARLTTPPAGTTDFPGDYSPDGTQFVFKRAVDEDPGPLMLVNVAGGEPQSLSTDVFEDPGRFSADGATVLTSAGGSIAVVSIDGEVLHRVSEEGAFLFGPVWSPDGTWIAYSRGTTGPFADIFVSRPDGTDRRQITETAANEIAIDWGSAPAADGAIDRVVDIGDGALIGGGSVPTVRQDS